MGDKDTSITMAGIHGEQNQGPHTWPEAVKDPSV